MTTIVSELYQALRSVGVADDLATAAAKAVIAADDKAELATKSDLAVLRAELLAAMAELKSELTQRLNDQTKTVMQLIVAMAALFSAISAALRFVKP